MAHSQSLAPRRRATYNPPEPDRISKRKIHRRRGACEPCRISKIKCDGRTPCGSCRFERRRHHPCVYSDKVMKSQHITVKTRCKADSDHSTISEASPAHSPDPSGTEPLITDDIRENYSQPEGGSVEVNETTRCHSPDSSAPGARSDNHTTFNPISFYAVVDEFRKLKPLRGVSAQIVSRCSGLEATSLTSKRKERLSQTDPVEQDATDSITNLTSEPLLSKENPRTQLWVLKLSRTRRLIQQGHFLQAWVDLASVVREAELIEADTQDEATPEERDSWRDMWSRTLDLECQLGLLLGRPTCLIRPSIPANGQSSDSTSPEGRMLDMTRIDLYQHVQALLSLDRNHPSISDQFLRKASEILTHEQFNKIGLCTREEDSTAVRDVQLNVHLLFMVIYCRLASMCDILPRNNNATLHAEVARHVGLHQPRSKVAYCRKMFRSANFVINIFLSLYNENPESISNDLVRCTSVLYTAIIIGIAKLRYEIAWGPTTELLQKLEKTFSEMAVNNPDCTIFRTAVSRLQDLDSIEKPVDVKHTMHGVTKHQKRNIQSTAHRTPDPTSNRRDNGVDNRTEKGPHSAEWVKQDSCVPEWVGPLLGQPSGDYTTLSSFEQQYDDSQTEDNSFSRDGSVYYSTLGSFNTRPTSATTSFNDSQCYDMNDDMTDDAGEVAIFPLTEPNVAVSATRDFQYDDHAVQSEAKHGQPHNTLLTPHSTHSMYDISLGSFSMPSSRIPIHVEVSPFGSQQDVCSINTVPTEITLGSNNESSSHNSVNQEGDTQQSRTPQRPTRYATSQWSRGQKGRPPLNRVLSDTQNQLNKLNGIGQNSPISPQKTAPIGDENRAPSRGRDVTPRAMVNTTNHAYPQYSQQSFIVSSTNQTPPQLRSGPQPMIWHSHHQVIPASMESSFYDPQPSICQQHNQYGIQTSPMYQGYAQFFPHGQEFVQYG